MLFEVYGAATWDGKAMTEFNKSGAYRIDGEP